MKLTFNYSKVRTVKDPVRGTKESAGIDFFIPEYEKQFVNDLVEKNPYITITNKMNGMNCITLQSWQKILIPSGIHVNFKDLDGDWGLQLKAENKSGVATKKGLDVMASVVDQDYQGEIHISLCNTTPNSVELFFGEKIIQFVLQPILLTIPTQVSIEELYPKESERGKGGFGSTGN